MLILHKLEEGSHVGSAKVVDGSQPGEHASIGNTLEVILANILEARRRKSVNILLNRTELLAASSARESKKLTNIVVLRSNLWKNCVMKMCISST